MGSSGAALFNNDVAGDVKHDFIDLLRRGLTPEAATEALKAEWAGAIGDMDDGPTFWLALAAIALSRQFQNQSGGTCLQPPVKPSSPARRGRSMNWKTQRH